MNFDADEMCIFMLHDTLPQTNGRISTRNDERMLTIINIMYEYSLYIYIYI